MFNALKSATSAALISQKERTRIFSWYILRQKEDNTILYYVNGDRITDELFRGKPVLRFKQYPILNVTKIIDKQGFQVCILNEKGENEILSCRWDMQDRFFIKRKSKLQDILSQTEVSKELVKTVLLEQEILEHHEEIKAQ